ncbi:MAG: cell division protein FtsX [Candidatus Parcubacteria bacterium]|nr:MAG: cell division protein FtsX [Candidatus Parcubacteria bacterium]
MSKLKKILKYGYDLFWQEKIISLINIGTTILVALFLWFGFLSFYFFNQMIAYLQERLDFSIYFRSNINREEILKLQKILQNFPGVKEVEFVPQEVALKKFQQEARANPVITRALKELQTNPLVDYLIVRTDNSEIYPQIADYIEKSTYRAYIDYISYFENQKVIKKIISISNQTKFLISILLIVILIFSALIIFNTILASIYSQREEIEVLRIIGAGNWFIRVPFFIYILIFSFLGYIIALGTLILFLMKTEDFWPTIVSNFQPSIFIADNFFVLNGIAFGLILLINFVSAFIAMEKYIKI